MPARPELGMPGVNLRVVLSDGNGTYPLLPISFGGGSERVFGTLWSSAPYYFIISPPPGGDIAERRRAAGRVPRGRLEPSGPRGPPAMTG